MAERRSSVAYVLLVFALVMAGASLVGCEESHHDDAPLISTDRVRPHPDRGACVACHVVAPAPTAVPRAAPLIGAHQARPHPDRGGCTACHAVTGL